MKKLLLIIIGLVISLSCYSQEIIQRNWTITKTYQSWGNFSDDEYDKFILPLNKPGTIKITNKYNKRTKQNNIYIDILNEDLKPIHEVIKHGHIFYSNTSDNKSIIIYDSNNDAKFMWGYAENAPGNKTVLIFFNATFLDTDGSKITNQYKF